MGKEMVKKEYATFIGCSFSLLLTLIKDGANYTKIPPNPSAIIFLEKTCLGAGRLSGKDEELE